MQRAFTLIELLVVVAIIGLISSVVLASVNSSREKSRDARRLADLNQIQKALELYYTDNKRYPPVDAANTGSSDCGTSWCTLETALADQIPKLPRDPYGLQDTWVYYYDSDSGDNYQTYGLMARFENSSNFWRVNQDGGFYTGTDCCYYELGDQPAYCMRRYSGNWWTGGTANVCAGGN